MVNLKTCGLSGEAVANREIGRFIEAEMKPISAARLVAWIVGATLFVGAKFFICRREKCTYVIQMCAACMWYICVRVEFLYVIHVCAYRVPVFVRIERLHVYAFCVCNTCACV